MARTGIPHRLHSDLPYPAKFRDAKEMACKTLPECITSPAFLLHSSQLCWWELSSTTPEPLQLPAAVSRLFPDVLFSTWTFSVAEHKVFFQLSCSERWGFSPPEQGSRQSLPRNFSKIFFISGFCLFVCFPPMEMFIYLFDLDLSFSEIKTQMEIITELWQLSTKDDFAQIQTSCEKEVSLCVCVYDAFCQCLQHH